MHFKSVSLDIGEGIFFVSGENRDEASSDSNGSGKSAFCQSISWCLFDDILRKGVLKDGIVGPHDEWCMASVEIEKEGRKILVKRYRNHPEFGHDVRIFIDGGEDKSKHKNEDSNKFIEALLGISSKVLYYCAYSDDDKEPFVALSSANLSKVVSEILESSRFDKYVKTVRGSMKELENESASQTSLMESEEKHISAYKLEIRDLEKQIEDFDIDKVEKAKQVRETISEIKSYINSYSGMTEGKLELVRDLEKLSPSVNEFNIIRTEIKDSMIAVSKIEGKLLAAEKKVYKINGDLESVGKSYDNIYNNMTGECHYCGNPLLSSRKLDSRSEKISKEKDKLTSELVIAELDRDEIKSKLSDIKLHIKKLSDKEEVLREDLVNYDQIKSKLSEIKDVENSLEFLREKLLSSNQKLKEVEDSKPSALIRHKNSKLDYLKELEAAKLNRITKILEIDKDIESLKVLLTAIKNTKSSLFNHFIMSLQDKINENLHKISEGDYSCALDVKGEDFVLTFARGGSGEAHSYHVFSKGERTRISKAVSVALNDMMGVGFYIDDEGLPGLDRSGVKNVLDFILSISGAKTLFFVSHDEAVRDYFKDSPNIHIIKEGGEGTVEVR